MTILSSLQQEEKDGMQNAWHLHAGLLSIPISGSDVMACGPSARSAANEIV